MGALNTCTQHPTPTRDNKQTPKSIRHIRVRILQRFAHFHQQDTQSILSAASAAPVGPVRVIGRVLHQRRSVGAEQKLPQIIVRPELGH